MSPSTIRKDAPFRIPSLGARTLRLGAGLALAGALGCTADKDTYTSQPVTLTAPTLETGTTTICTWKDDKACAYTPTYDDGNIKSLQIWDTLHQKYGIVGNMGLIAGWIDDCADQPHPAVHTDPLSSAQGSDVFTSIGAWDDYKALANNGRWEVSSHSVRHLPVSYFGSAYLQSLGLIPVTATDTAGNPVDDQASGILELDAMFKDSRDELEAKLGVPVETFIYPYFDYGQAPALSYANGTGIPNLIPSSVVLTEGQKYYLAARAGDEAARFPIDAVGNTRIVPMPSGAVDGLNDPDMTNYMAYDCRIEGDSSGWDVYTDGELRHLWVDQAIQFGGYLTITFHGISVDDANNPVESPTVYQACPQFWYEDHYAYVQAHSAKIWNDTMAHVHKYMRERRWALTSVLSRTSSSVTLGLTLDPSVALAPDVYQFPLTLKTEVIGAWKTATITQGTTTVTTSVRAGGTGASYVQYDAVPGGDPISIAFSN